MATLEDDTNVGSLVVIELSADEATKVNNTVWYDGSVGHYVGALVSVGDPGVLLVTSVTDDTASGTLFTTGNVTIHVTRDQP